MRVLVAVALGLALAACSPPQPAADRVEAVIRAVYAAATGRAAHGQVTSVDDVPLSDALAASIREASAVAEANNEPFIDGDIVLACQDCSAVGGLAIATTTPPANGRAVVEAHFTVDAAVRVESFDMVETPQGWRIDNIRSADGYDLRRAASDEIASASRSCTEQRGAEEAVRLAAQCTQVSPATHPPCNAANSCAMMEGEIRRGCGMLEAAQRPAFCNADEAP